MKIIEKIKKIFTAIGVSCITLTTKVFAKPNVEEYVINTPLYGVETPEPVIPLGIKIWNICQVLIIPLILLIGIIVYFKKSKSSTKKKIIISLIVFIFAVLIMAGIKILLYLLLK